MASELKKEYDDMGIEASDEAIAKSIDLCISYHIEDAAEFVEQWIAFSVSNLNGAEPTIDYLLEFERKVLQAKRDKELAAASIKKKAKYSNAGMVSLAQLNAASAAAAAAASMTMDTNPLAMYGVGDNDVIDDFKTEIGSGAGSANEDDVCRTPKNSLNESQASESEQADCNDIKAKIMTGAYQIVPQKGRSRVWEVFGRVGNGSSFIENIVGCKTCCGVFKYKNSTSNLVKHKCYKRMRTMGFNQPKDDIPEETKAQVVRTMTEWVVKDCRSFKIVEDDGMKKFTELLLAIGANYGQNVDVGKLLPQPTTVSSNIDALYSTTFDALQNELEELQITGFGLTSDLWTDNFLKMTYLALTIHYIQNGKLEKKLLAMKSMNFETCSNDKILRKINATLSEFHCDLNDAIIVTDRGSNMKSAFKGKTHIYCINHLLHNIVEKSINEVTEIKDLCAKCVKIVKYLKKSEANSRLTTTLKSVSVTKWNTVYYLLQSIQDNWTEVGNILKARDQLTRLSGINIDVLTATAKILKSFQQASKELEADNYPTLHLSIVHVYHLLRVCGNKNENDLDCIKMFKNKLQTQLKNVVLKNMNMFHKIALFLFPPTNKLTQYSLSEKDEIKAECRKMMEKYGNDFKSNSDNMEHSGQPLSTEKQNLFSGFLDTSNAAINFESIQNELILYENTNETMHDDFDVLQWWQFNKLKFPHLYKLSCKILATPATSASCERVFSSARQLLSEKRCLIGSNPVSVEKIMFLNSNLKI